MRKVLLLLTLTALVSQAGAAQIYWKGGGTTTNWSDGTNWVGGVVPGSADVAYFKSDYSGDQVITIDQNISVSQIYGHASRNVVGSVTFNNGGAYTLKTNLVYWYGTGGNLTFNVPVDRNTANYIDIRLVGDNITFNQAVGSHDGGGTVYDKYFQTVYGTGGTGTVYFNAATQNTRYFNLGSNIEMGNPSALPNLGLPNDDGKSGLIYQTLTGVTVKNLSGDHTIRMNTFNGASGFTLNVNGMAPGQGTTGTLSFLDSSLAGGAQLNLSGSSKFELGALGGAQDLVNFIGTTFAYSMVVSGTLDITNIGGLQAGDYTLFDMGTMANWSGSFSAVNMPAGFNGTVVKAADNDLVLHVTAVPEPATMSLLVAGGLAAMIRRRR